ncbi:YopX family protein [Streptococcus parauberis]|uniref:YopX family protein n=1 Tax=Streptococcus parauberis TaxID=1348 RepID=UPI0037AC5056
MIPNFRAWDKANKKMCDVKAWSEFNGGEVTIKRDGENASYVVPLDDIVLMQSTGLFDNSEPPKEIFEGDIVETIYNGKLFTGVVVYDQEETDFKATDGRNEYGNNFYYLGGNDSNIVIGNVHQHPDLLESVEVEWWKLNDGRWI